MCLIVCGFDSEEKKFPGMNPEVSDIFVLFSLQLFPSCLSHRLKGT